MLAGSRIRPRPDAASRVAATTPAMPYRITAQGRGDKVKIFKMRRRKHYQKHQGHRQSYTELRIDSIAS